MFFDTAIRHLTVDPSDIADIALDKYLSAPPQKADIAFSRLSDIDYVRGQVLVRHSLPPDVATVTGRLVG
jgi:hypothetical protein